MTAQRINDNSLMELRYKVAELQKELEAMRNNPVITLPIRTPDNLPVEAGEGDVVMGENGTGYKYLNGAWSPFTSGLASSIVETISVPGYLSHSSASDIDPARAFVFFGGTIQQVHLSVGIAPTGSNITVRLRKNGSVIGTGTILAGASTGSITPSPATFVTGDYFTVDIPSFGSTYAGNSLVVKMVLDAT